MTDDDELSLIKIGDSVRLKYENWTSDIYGFVCETYNSRYLKSKWIGVAHKEHTSAVNSEYYNVRCKITRLILTEKSLGQYKK